MFRFRWAVCQLEALQNCVNLPSLRKALASLPKTLDETYARILCSIPEEYTDYAIRMLQFLTYSTRPLEIGELAELVAINPHGNPWFDHEARLPEPRDVLTICTGLVVEEERHESSNEDSYVELDEEDDVELDEEDDVELDEDDDAELDEDDDAESDEDDDAKSDESDDAKLYENDGERSEDRDEHRDEDRDVGSDDTSENKDGHGNNDDDGENNEGIDEENSKIAESAESIDEYGKQSISEGERKDMNGFDENGDLQITFWENEKNPFKNRNIIRLAHFSVKEYLVSERIRSRYAEEASKYAI